jgi:hypothetical protein
VCMKNDSIEGIYDTLKECAAISKSAGGSIKQGRKPGWEWTACQVRLGLGWIKAAAMTFKWLELQAGHEVPGSST